MLKVQTFEARKNIRIRFADIRYSFPTLQSDADNNLLVCE